MQWCQHLEADYGMDPWVQQSLMVHRFISAPNFASVTPSMGVLFPIQRRGKVSLAAYVSEDGLVGHQWKERPIGLANFICLSTGECQG